MSVLAPIPAGGGYAVKLFLCDCGDPAVGRTSGKEPICERCLRLERYLRELKTANKLVGVPQDARQLNHLPAYQLVDKPVAGGSLEILNLMLGATLKMK